MTLEDQVCNLELSKRLKELGVKQESLFWWIGSDDDDDPEIYPSREPIWKWCEDTEGTYPPSPEDISEDMGSSEQAEDIYAYSAFTVAELGEMLPYAVDSSRRTVEEIDKFYCIHPKGIVIIERTEANARAKMLVYLLENKLSKLN